MAFFQTFFFLSLSLILSLSVSISPLLYAEPQKSPEVLISGFFFGRFFTHVLVFLCLSSAICLCLCFCLSLSLFFFFFWVCPFSIESMHRTTQNIDLRLLFWGPVFLPMFLSLFNYLSFSLRRYASLLSYRTLYAGNR